MATRKQRRAKLKRLRRAHDDAPTESISTHRFHKTKDPDKEAAQYAAISASYNQRRRRR